MNLSTRDLSSEGYFFATHSNLPDSYIAILGKEVSETLQRKQTNTLRHRTRSEI